MLQQQSIIILIDFKAQDNLVKVFVLSDPQAKTTFSFLLELLK